MDRTFADSYTFGFAGVRQKAPEASGVYVIYSSSRWIHIGESGDIRRSLLRHLNESAPRMDDVGPLSFGFELWDEVGRVARRRALVAELAPTGAGRVHPASAGEDSGAHVRVDEAPTIDSTQPA